MLKYIGRGALPGIPQRNLSDAEIKKYTTEKKLRGLGLSDAEISKVKSGKDFLIGAGLFISAPAQTIKKEGE